MNRAELFPFFRDVTEPGRSELGALPAVRVEPQKQLLGRGDSANGAYLVLEGALRVYYITDEGREATLYRVEPGGTCVLALSSTLHERPFPAWVEASTSGATFVRVPDAVFQRLLNQEGAFRSFVLSAMSERIFELMCTLEQLATSTMEQRVAAYLAARVANQTEIATTQTMIASELGTAREVVFRALRALAGRGLIVTTRGRVRVVDYDGLADAGGRNARSFAELGSLHPPLVDASG